MTLHRLPSGFCFNDDAIEKIDNVSINDVPHMLSRSVDQLTGRATWTVPLEWSYEITWRQPDRDGRMRTDRVYDGDIAAMKAFLDSQGTWGETKA